MRSGPTSFLERMFTDPSFVWYRYFQNFIAFFIITSCIGIALETLTDFVELYQTEMKILENITLVIFILEYIGNFYFAKKKMQKI